MIKRKYYYQIHSPPKQQNVDIDCLQLNNLKKLKLLIMKIQNITVGLILVTSFIFLSCKKTKTEIETCTLNSCDPNRKTILVANEWTGTLGYYNELRKWAVNVSIPNTYDGVRTCIICTDIPDSLKTIGNFVTFSGELKESCENPKPELRGQEIYFVNPTKLK
jgi:hypothetical protein